MNSYRFRVGSIACRVIADGENSLTEERMRRAFPNHAEPMVAALHESSTPPSMSRNILYLDVVGTRVLVDVGSGHHEAGVLLDTLRAEGITPESINTVILTHFHLDHLGGLLDAAGKRMFPNARLVAAQREYDHWMNEAFLATMDAQLAQTMRDTFAAYPNLKLVDGETQIESGVWLIPMLGHTPGHLGVLVELGDERLLHIVDAVHVASQLNISDAVPRYDSQPEVAVATRRALFERAVNENLRLMIYHFPFPGVGHIQRANDRLTWLPE